MLTGKQQYTLTEAIKLINSVRIDLVPNDDEVRDNEGEQQLFEIEESLYQFIYDWS